MAKIILLAIALISIPAPAFAGADLVRCEGKDAVNLQSDGTLRKDASAEEAMGDTYLVDISTGIVRISGYGGTAHLDPQQWTVVQKGNGGNDAILVPDRSGSAFIRTRQWTPLGGAKAGPIIFVRYYLETLVSGTCEPVR